MGGGILPLSQSLLSKRPLLPVKGVKAVMPLRLGTIALQLEAPVVAPVVEGTGARAAAVMPLATKPRSMRAKVGKQGNLTVAEVVAAGQAAASI